MSLLASLVLSPALMSVGQAGAQGPSYYPDASGVHFYEEQPGQVDLTIQESFAPPFGGANITVNSPAAGAQNETTIAINPAAPRNLIAGANDYRGSDTACGSYFSKDNGATWIDNTPLPYEATFTASGDPGVAFNSSGHGFFLCMNFVRDADDATQYVYKSFDGGDTWGPGILAAGAPHANFDDKGHIAVDARPGSPYNGNVYVAFARLNTGELKFNRSIDGGNSFIGCPAACGDFAVNDVSGGSGANITVGESGSVYLGWNRNYNDGTHDRAEIRIDKSTDGGVTFNALGGDVVIRNLIRDSTGSGRPRVRPLPRVNFFPSLGSSPFNDGVVYAVWMEDVPGIDDSDIYFARSIDGGATWSTPKRINDDVNPIGDYHSQFFPWLAVDPVDGEIDIVWYDDRNDPDRTDGHPLVDLYFASSNDSGLSFSKNLRVSTQSSDISTNFSGGFFGDYNAVASYDGVAHPFWCDSSSGEQQVLTTAVGGADLSIAKSDAPDPVFAGQLLRYNLAVTNHGPAAAFNVTVEDTLPVQVEYQTSTVACTQAGQVLTCELGNLAAGDSASFSIEVLVLSGVAKFAPISITNTAIVSSDQEDPDDTNNTAFASTVVNAMADLEVTKECKPDLPLYAGGGGLCTIRIRNWGPSDAKDITLTDVHMSQPGYFDLVPGYKSPGITCVFPSNPVPTSGSIACALATLAAGAGKEIEVGISTDQGLDINDTATIRAETPDPNTANNSASDGLTFLASADLSLTKTAAATVIAGTNLTYELTVTNNGPSAATNVVISDVLPAGVIIVSVGAAGATCNAGIPGNAAVPTTCTFDTMVKSVSRFMVVEVKVDPSFRGVLSNNARVSSDTHDQYNANNLATAVTTVNALADLQVGKYRTSGQPIAGAQIDYQVRVANNGPSTATGVMLFDSLPSWVRFVSSSPTCVENPTDRLACDLGTVQPHESIIVYITGIVDPATPEGTGITNSAGASGNESDPDIDNNTAHVSDTVYTRADLWIDKVGNFPTGNPSGTIVYSLYVYNKPGCELNSGFGNADPSLDCWNASGGPSDAQNVVITDTLPLDPKTFIVQYVSPNCTYDAATHKVICYVKDASGNPLPLPAGSVAGPFQIQAVVKGSRGTFTNRASVQSTTFDPNPANNVDDVKTTVQGGTGKKGGGR